MTRFTSSGASSIGQWLTWWSRTTDLQGLAVVSRDAVWSVTTHRMGPSYEQVIGSNGGLELRKGPGGKPVLVKLAKVDLVDDGAGKPLGIQRFIGRRPIFAFGNSDGDQQMLEWTAAGDGPRFMGLVYHTDAEREFAYDRTSHVGKLDKAWDEAVARKWAVVDMKKDWKQVFANP
jgi:hypothetical protein